IDPGDNAPALQAALREHGLTVTAFLATHVHFAHVLAGRALQEATGAPFLLHPAERPLLATMRGMTLAWLGYDPGEPPQVTHDLTPGRFEMSDSGPDSAIRNRQSAIGNPVAFGAETLEVRATPGHSPGGVTLVHHASRRAFTGDALFAGGIGRTDLPGGDLPTLLAAIRSQILTLPADYIVLPGHGPASTVGAERLTNPYLSEDGW
ncbi:MAG: hydroxyacylglutathione hydrolase, partial [Chloroflexota bacterium]|nr:hydroxyacylglutathione hydrolase [Chloroflexota bacterium]